MIITECGTIVIYKKEKNQVIINLPQTLTTLVSSANPVMKRIVDIDEYRLLVLGRIADELFEVQL